MILGAAAIMIAATIVDLLLTSVAIKITRVEVRALTICYKDSMRIFSKLRSHKLLFTKLFSKKEDKCLSSYSALLALKFV